MPKLEKAILSLHSLSSPSRPGNNAIALLLQTIVYLAVVLSVPLYAPQKLIWLAVYPVVVAEMSGIGFGRVFLKSLWVLPLVVMIGIFNPFIDKETAFFVGSIPVNRGWVSFFSIVVRGLLAVQAAYLLTVSAGFYDICSAMRKICVPRILVTQMQFTYRYMTVIAEEALGMDRARKARGYGKNNYPMKEWGRIVGQLLVRSYERSQRIHRAMLARGFDGKIPVADNSISNPRSWISMTIWIIVIIAIRFVNKNLLF